MKYLSILVVFVLLVGCGKQAKLGGSIITLNGCQYAVYNPSKGGAGICHAGNCNNPIHQPQKPILDSLFGSSERLVTIDTVSSRLYFRPIK